MSQPAAYPLTPMQAGMLFEALFLGGGYNLEQLHGNLDEELEPALFAAAWTYVVQRHPALSASFRWEGLAAPLQQPNPDVTVRVEVRDWKSLASESVAAELRAFLERDRAAGMDLTRAPLMRVTIFELANAKSAFVWTFHHLLLDGRSMPSVLREVFAVYTARQSGRAPELGPPPASHSAFVGWLEARDKSPSLGFFSQLLRGKTAPTPLPFAIGAAPASEPSAPGELEKQFDAQNVDALRRLATQTQTTFGTVVYAAWSLVLARLTQSDDVLFGVARACRRSALDGAVEMVGMFMNTVPLRARLDPDATVSTFLRELRRVTLELRAHEHTPLVDIHGQSAISRRLPLFYTLVMFETQELNRTLQKLGPEWRGRRFTLYEQPSVPVTLVVIDAERLGLRLLFDRRRLEPKAAQRLLSAFGCALALLAEDPARRLSDLTLV